MRGSTGGRNSASEDVTERAGEGDAAGGAGGGPESSKRGGGGGGGSDEHSKELQGWPELVDIHLDLHRTRNTSLYGAMYQGNPVALKVLRFSSSMEGRPGE